MDLGQRCVRSIPHLVLGFAATAAFRSFTLTVSNFRSQQLTLKRVFARLPIRHDAGKQLLPSWSVIGMQGVREFVSDNVVDQGWRRAHEIEVEDESAFGSEAPPTVC